jgi:hypothetical protein
MATNLITNRWSLSLSTSKLSAPGLLQGPQEWTAATHLCILSCSHAQFDPPVTYLGTGSWKCEFKNLAELNLLAFGILYWTQWLIDNHSHVIIFTGGRGIASRQYRFITCMSFFIRSPRYQWFTGRVPLPAQFTESWKFRRIWSHCQAKGNLGMCKWIVLIAMWISPCLVFIWGGVLIKKMQLRLYFKLLICWEAMCL